ncbi:MAG: cyclomaltodextrinase N-terminal domain-containing protein [Paludibacteraceae bacterium]|nr:cyclomaltodextrinase N-terminal domain-containing protein [Paludibacteraceae bacterium]MBQ6983846.1 cyclomaltodextrinase N-terminal domain-containing protein [Paludibacteraceae bacterium]
MTFAAPKIQQVEPLSWWTNMSTPLTLLFHGEDLQDAQVSVQQVIKGKTVRGACLGLVPTAQHNAESPNYLFVDMAVNQPGTYRITLKKGNKKATVDYVINERREGSRERQSFTSADVVYLIMSDRFVDGDPSNNSTADTREKADKSNVNGRFGGDIQGIINSFDHIAKLGCTAIWPTPMLGDDEAAWSYHGYACSDYYHIDPRYGSNALYADMVQQAHTKGLKILMDMVPNHCGAAHWWMSDLPYQDWINQFPQFTNTNNCFTANYDINASEYDRQLSNRGWFDTPMPDMNLENPDLLKYFQQWAIWWIEFADLDGLRVDTYPYIEKIPGSEWLKAIRNEYPDINIVGECWTRPAPAVAYWQSGVKNFDGFDSNLPTVMDFPTEEAIRQALENDGNYWGGGLTRVYDALTLDYMYADVNRLFTFLGNHDMARITDVVKDKDPRRVKLAYVLLATMRGIPQVLYGDEYAMTSKGEDPNSHSYLRAPLPQGAEVTDEMKVMYDFQSRLFQWRKHEPVLHTGRTMHFLARNNTYAFFRYNDQEAVFVFANAAEEPRIIPTETYKEILSKYKAIGMNPLTGERVDLNRKDLQVPALGTLVVKLLKR